MVSEKKTSSGRASVNLKRKKTGSSMNAAIISIPNFLFAAKTKCTHELEPVTIQATNLLASRKA
jgi:hypothetical protein